MAGPQSFTLVQHFAMTVNRYDIRARATDGVAGSVTAWAQETRMPFKREVTFYADRARTQPIFGFKPSRKHREVGDVYDVADAEGQLIGTLRKDVARSLLRSTWHVSTPDGLTAVGRERSLGVAIGRRIFDLLNGPPIAWRFHFDFMTSDGQVVLTSQCERAIRDLYEITMPVLPDGRQLDWRVGAAMAVALDALQRR